MATSAAAGAVQKQQQQGLLLRFLRAACAAGDSLEDAANRSAVAAVSAFAAASPAHLRLVLADAPLTKAWLALPAAAAGKAFALHSVANVLCPRLLAQPPDSPPQPPLVTGYPAFAGAPPNAPGAATATVARAAEWSGGVCADPQAWAAPAAVDKALVEAAVAKDVVGRAAEAKAALFAALGHCNGEGIMELLMLLLRAPISETRHGAFDVLRAAARAEGRWGIHAMVTRLRCEHNSTERPSGSRLSRERSHSCGDSAPFRSNAHGEHIDGP